MRFHTVIKSLGYTQVVNELMAAGQLSTQPEAFAKSKLTDGKRHLNVGAIDIEASKTLSSWLWPLTTLKPRCVVFVNKLATLPTIWHRDGPYAQCAINIPWFGSEHTFTEWTDDGGLTENVVTHANGKVDRIEGFGNKEATESAKLHDAAWLLDIHAYHRVRSTNDIGYRGLLSIRFGEPGLTYAQLCNALRLD